MTTFGIRAREPEDDEGIVELLRKTFPKWDKSIDPLKLWRWKYVDSPHQNKITVIIADNKVIGCDHHKIFHAKIGSELTTLTWSDDLAIDAEYRGQGLWAKMDDFQSKDATFKSKYHYETTTNPKVIHNNAKKNQEKFPFPVNRMVKINDINLHLRMRPMKNNILLRTGYQSLKVLNKTKNLFKPEYKQNDDYNLEIIQGFDERINGFWEKIKDDYDFILEKKCGFLNWRFSKPVRGHYIFIQATKGEDPLGFLVIGLSEDEGYTEARIEDLLALNYRLDVAYALLDYACKHLDELGINTVYYQVVEGHPYQELSKMKGFIDSGSKPNIYFNITKKYREEMKEIEIQSIKKTSPGRFYFNYADTI